VTKPPVFPELVTGRDDQFAQLAWTVKPGWALRGHASCDFVARVLEVPLGNTVGDRVIRGHELMHVRVSPHDVNPLSVYPDITARALECAEEFRVNELLRRTGFPVAALCDGSEDVSGQRLAANNAWEEAVYFYVATIGTGAERALLRGVRKVRPEWAKPLAALRRRALQRTASLTGAEIGATTRRDEAELPAGFELVSVPLARLMMTVADAAVPASPDQLRQFRRSLEPGGRRAPTGRFAPLIFDTALAYESTPVGRSGRRIKPDVTGLALRYPSRLLTDPHRRAFGRPQRSDGGVVIVDQSGSMDLAVAEVAELLVLAPGATVIGYSHRPGDKTGRPNAWVIAKRGRRVREPPSGNVGNGVDGPVLRWALARRRAGESVLWVTDGQVTDSNDHPSRQLSLECARLVLHHRIALVRSLGEASARLSRRERGDREPRSQFGRVGRELMTLAD
jgi:hypothetical protein